MRSLCAERSRIRVDSYDAPSWSSIERALVDFVVVVAREDLYHQEDIGVYSANAGAAFQ